uniref:Release factor glutamine methyltransferase n=1 Tax=Desulfobacca acetoxidans TaxID=60893 RepID=A0A7V6A497_9BACT
MSTTQLPWTILSLLQWTTGYFEENGVSEPRASAEILLAHTLGLSRLDLYLRHDQPLTPEELARFKALIVRRRLGEPVAYLTGHKEFWSLDFLVTPATLIPRPETEVLVEAVLEVCGGEAGEPRSPGPPLNPLLALDVGVGSGALVVALAKELPDLQWLAVDISAAALQVVRENARRHGVGERIAFLQGDLLTPFKPVPCLRLLVANLPYVPRVEWEQLPREIRDYEPRGALLGGEDGLDLIKQVCAQAHHYLQAGGWLGLEVGAGQAGSVMGFLDNTKAYDTLKTVDDYQGIPRVVLAKRSKRN